MKDLSFRAGAKAQIFGEEFCPPTTTYEDNRAYLDGWDCARLYQRDGFAPSELTDKYLMANTTLAQLCSTKRDNK